MRKNNVSASGLLVTVAVIFMLAFLSSAPAQAEEDARLNLVRQYMQLRSDTAVKIDISKAADVAYDDGDDCLVIPAYSEEFPVKSALLADEDKTALQSLVDRKVITGKSASCYFLPTPSRTYKGVLVLGLGKRDELDAEGLRRCAGAAVAALKQHRVRRLYLEVVHFPELTVEAFVEGIILGQYTFDTYKKPDPDTPPAAVAAITIVVADDADVASLAAACHETALIASAANYARRLGDTAANDMTPTTLALAAQEIGALPGSQCNVVIMEEAEMAELGMNALLGVTRGSAEPAKLIFMEYRHPDAKRTVALVGKGVTFDTGGISIKGGSGMHEMKYDMSGAAAVICTLMAVSELKPVLNVIGVVPTVSNMPDGRAQTPGDVVRAYNGKTIETWNTDAEGRLILADALAYTVDKYKPDYLVDIATLTGAVSTALGKFAAAVIGTDEALIAGLIQAGEETGERLWQLPLWKDYHSIMDGRVADLANINPDGRAGTIAGAVFLKHFAGDTPWAHLDIAGTAYGVTHLPYLESKYATGFGVRLLTRWVREQTKE